MVGLSGCDEGINQPPFNNTDTTGSGNDNPPANDGNVNYGALYWSTENLADAADLVFTGGARFTNGAIYCANNGSDAITATCIGGPVDFSTASSITFISWPYSLNSPTYTLAEADDPGGGKLPTRWQELNISKNEKGWDKGALVIGFGGNVKLYFKLTFTLPADAVIRIKPFKAYGK